MHSSPGYKGKGLDGCIADKLLSTVGKKTCTISWLGIKSISFTLCPSSLPTSRCRGITLWGRVSRSAFMRGMSMKSLLYCFSPHDGAEDKSPPGQELTFTFRFLDMHVCCTQRQSVHTHTHTQTLLGKKMGFWSLSAASTEGLQHTNTRMCLCRVTCM